MRYSDPTGHWYEGFAEDMGAALDGTWDGNLVEDPNVEGGRNFVGPLQQEGGGTSGAGTATGNTGTGPATNPIGESNPAGENCPTCHNAPGQIAENLTPMGPGEAFLIGFSKGLAAGIPIAASIKYAPWTTPLWVTMSLPGDNHDPNAPKPDIFSDDTNTKWEARGRLVGESAPALRAAVKNAGPLGSKSKLHTNTVLNRSERLDIFRKRLSAAPSAKNPNGVIRLINKTLDDVEDAYSGIARDKAGALRNRDSGRMYGILDDTYVKRHQNGNVTALTKGHRIEIGRSGSFSIYERRTGNVFLIKD